MVFTVKITAMIMIMMMVTDGDGDSDGELVLINLIITLVLNFSRKSTIAVTGSTALCSVVPVTATTLMTGISLSNFSFSVRYNSKR